eukprot:COSAG01_NODE_1014_length_12131_cov_10.088749_10_plen_154_part_00
MIPFSTPRVHFHFHLDEAPLFEMFSLNNNTANAVRKPMGVIETMRQRQRDAMPNDFCAASAGEVYDMTYYLKGALAGGTCCSITHGALCPVDVVKTRIQLDPVKYNKGLIGGFSQVTAEEGAGALLTGLGATAVGYFVQGAPLPPTSFLFLWA